MEHHRDFIHRHRYVYIRDTHSHSNIEESENWPSIDRTMEEKSI